MVTYAVAAKEVILCKENESLVKIFWTFAVLKVDVGKINKMCPGGFKAKCIRMADQIESIEVEFLTMVFLEITGQ